MEARKIKSVELTERPYLGPRQVRTVEGIKVGKNYICALVKKSTIRVALIKILKVYKKYGMWWADVRINDNEKKLLLLESVSVVPSKKDGRYSDTGGLFRTTGKTIRWAIVCNLRILEALFEEILCTPLKSDSSPAL